MHPALALLACCASLALAQAPPSFRLPDNAAPVRYAVDLKLAPPDDAFSGTVEMEIQLREATSTIWMHAEDLKPEDIAVRAGGQSIPARAVTAGKDFLGVALEHPAGPGRVTVRINYRGRLSKTSSDGLFLNTENGDSYVFTQFEPTSARRAFPCFDEPRFKTPWQLTINVPKGNRAFANTPVVSETPQPDGTVTFRFAESKPLPSYLVALAAGPIETVDAGTAGAKKVPVRILAPRGRAADAAFAASVTPEIVDRLEKYFGIPYPYEKLDSVAIPLVYGFGAMENAGLVTYAQNLILAKPADQSVNFQRSYINIATHELAHQWFGDLVTMAWWDDIWLNEAFATWMQQKIVGAWKPEWKLPVTNVFSKQFAMENDSLVSARRIRQPIATADDIANGFDAITYQKGAAVIRMFENWVGEEPFRKGVRLYLEKHAWGNATSADFLAGISTGAGKDIRAAFSSFLDQPGVPLVNVRLRCDGGAAALALEQRRYLPLGSPGAPPQTWQIPVCVRYGGSAECSLLSTPAAEMKLAARGCPDWVEANAGENGYYHVRYEGSLLDKLVENRGGRLSAPEQAGLLGDARALMRGGQLPAEKALGMARDFSGRPERQIVTATIGIVTGVEQMATGPLRPAYARFIRDTYGARARSLGWSPRPGESEDERLLRATLLGLVAREGEDRQLAAEARKLAERWLADRSAVSADIVATVLATAAQFGDAALFERFLDAARAEKSRLNRQRLIAALGSFRDPELARRALGLTLTGPFDARETIGLFTGPLQYPETRALPFEFVKEHFDELAARLPRGIGSDAAAQLPQVGSAFCTSERRDEVRAFFGDRIRRFTGGPRVLAQVLEGIQVCSAVRQAQQESAGKFFAAR